MQPLTINPEFLELNNAFYALRWTCINDHDVFLWMYLRLWANLNYFPFFPEKPSQPLTFCDVFHIHYFKTSKKMISPAI